MCAGKKEESISYHCLLTLYRNAPMGRREPGGIYGGIGEEEMWKMKMIVILRMIMGTCY